MTRKNAATGGPQHYNTPILHLPGVLHNITLHQEWEHLWTNRSNWPLLDRCMIAVVFKLSPVTYVNKAGQSKSGYGHLESISLTRAIRAGYKRIHRQSKASIDLQSHPATGRILAIAPISTLRYRLSDCQHINDITMPKEQNDHYDPEIDQCATTSRSILATVEFSTMPHGNAACLAFALLASQGSSY